MEEITNCCICNDGSWEDGNPIVFCDGCDIGVHVKCYGAPLSGAMKRTTDAQWCHICCAIWIPEVFFIDSDALESIDYYQICKYCNEKGTCVGCCECHTKFHIPCGIEKNVLLEYKAIPHGKDIIVTYCDIHSVEARKKTGWKMRFIPKEDA